MKHLSAIFVSAAILVSGCIFLSALPAFAVTANIPNVQAPSSHSPSMQQQIQGKCSPGYTKAKYQGKDVCVKCVPGHRYTQYQGKDMCIKCSDGFTYTKYYGNDKCVQCNPGFTYGKHEGKDMCVK